MSDCLEDFLKAEQGRPLSARRFDVVIFNYNREKAISCLRHIRLRFFHLFNIHLTNENLITQYKGLNHKDKPLFKKYVETLHQEWVADKKFSF